MSHHDLGVIELVFGSNKVYELVPIRIPINNFIKL